MDEAKPSRTAEIPALMRALHQVRDDDPKILIDPVAGRLADVANADREWLSPILNHPFAPQWRAGFLIRNRYAEDCLAEAVSRGARQYLILGAGLDTFAYRQPNWARDIAIFEIDHPASQAAKSAAVAKAGIPTPPNLTFMPVDFETTTLSEAFREHGFTFDSVAFCSLLGVSQYLTQEAIETTLNFILSLPPKSELVLSFILPQTALRGIEADAVATAAVKAAETGEPWLSRFHPEELGELLRRKGFSHVERFTPADSGARYLKDRRDGLAPRVGEQLMRAVV